MNRLPVALIDRNTDLTLGKALRWLWRHAFSRRRRLQGAFVLALMFVGAIAELFTIGAVIPFLAVFADPGGFHKTSRFASMFVSIGLTPSHFTLKSMGLLFCGIAVFAAIIRIVLAWISQKYVFRIGFDIGTLLYGRMLHQPYSFHIRINSSRIIATLENIQKLLTGTFIPIMQACTAFVIGSMIVIGLILLAPVLATVAFGGFLAIYSSISLVTRPRLRSNARIIESANKSRVQAVQEGLGGIRDVLIDNAQNIYLQNFSKIDNRLRRAQGANALIAVAPRFIAEAAGMILLISLAIIASDSGNVTRSLPVLGALALGAGRLLPLMQQSYLGWAKLMGDSALIINVVGLLKEPVQPRFTGPDCRGASAAPSPRIPRCDFPLPARPGVSRTGGHKYLHSPRVSSGSGREKRQRQDDDARSADGTAPAEFGLHQCRRRPTGRNQHSVVADAGRARSAAHLPARCDDAGKCRVRAASGGD